MNAVKTINLSTTDIRAAMLTVTVFKMMRQIERGKIGKVIVYRLDRISRSLSDFVGILETLKSIMFSLFPLKNPSTRQVRTVK